MRVIHEFMCFALRVGIGRAMFNYYLEFYLQTQGGGAQAGKEIETAWLGWGTQKYSELLFAPPPPLSAFFS